MRGGFFDKILFLSFGSFLSFSYKKKKEKNGFKKSNYIFSVNF